MAFVTLPLLASQARAQAPARDRATEAEPALAAKQEAARRFEHAVDLYEEEDYQLALAEFARAYELVPRYQLLYNIGQVNMQLGRHATALVTLREYVKRGGAELSPERLEAVQGDLQQLAARTARLTLHVEPAGAEAWIDGKLAGTTPLAEPLVLDVGERRIELRRRGYLPQARSLSVAAGDERELRLALEPRAALTAPTKPVRADHPSSRSSVSSWTWAGYTAAGALATGALVSGALGATSASDLSDLRRSPDASRQSLDDAKSRARSRLLVADILGAAALITGSVTLYLQLTAPGRARQRGQGELRIALSPTALTLSLSQ